MATLVDSSVLLDVLTEDQQWFEWSAAALADAYDAGPLAINAIIYAEISVRFDRIEDLTGALAPGHFNYEPLPREVAFLAAKACATGGPVAERPIHYQIFLLERMPR